MANKTFYICIRQKYKAIFRSAAHTFMKNWPNNLEGIGIDVELEWLLVTHKAARETSINLGGPARKSTVVFCSVGHQTGHGHVPVSDIVGPAAVGFVFLFVCRVTPNKNKNRKHHQRGRHHKLREIK